MKVLFILATLLITASLSMSAYANQSQGLHEADTLQVLHSQNDASNLKTSSHAYKNPADEAWEGVTYIIDNEGATNLNEIPYINYHFN